MTFDELVAKMLKHRIVRAKSTVRTGLGGQEEVELELHSSAFVQTSALAPSAGPGLLSDLTGAGMCKCTHPLTDHGQDGLCLRGCDEDACEVVEARA